MDLYERLERAAELRKEATELRGIVAQRGDKDLDSYEWTRSAVLDAEADELDGTAERNRKRQEERQKAHEERMKLYHAYHNDPAVSKQALINKVIATHMTYHEAKQTDLPPEQVAHLFEHHLEHMQRRIR